MKAPSPELVAWLSLVSVVLTCLGALVAIYVAIGVRTLHVMINSRLTQLLKSTGLEQRALGDAEGTERERVRKEKGNGEDDRA